MFKSKRNKSPKIDTLVDAKTRIHGDVEFAGGMRLDGHINGNVYGESGRKAELWVSDGGTIAGSVMVSSIVLNGLVQGDIDATGRVELGQNARVLGNVRYSTIETAVGAQINGNLVHRSAPEASGAAEAPAESTQL
jgi:cytoskeletal protein CcmA (bactofilin family)